MKSVDTAVCLYPSSLHQLLGRLVMTLMAPVKSADTMISLSSVSSSKHMAVAELSAMPMAMRKMKEGLGAKTAAVTTALWTGTHTHTHTEQTN